MQKLLRRCGTAVASGCLGVFLVIRLKAFLIQAFAVELPMWSLYAVIAVLVVGAAVLYEPVVRILRELCPESLGVRFGTGAVAMAVSFLLGKALAERMLENAAVSMSSAARIAYLLGAGILLGLFLLVCIPSVHSVGVWTVKRIKRANMRDVALLLLLWVAVNAATYAYAIHSSTIYYWDNAGYWNTAWKLAQQWQENGFLSLIRSVYESVLTEDYNYLVAVPAVLFARVFGHGRWAFLLSIANFGYYPILVLIWLAAERITPKPRIAVVVLMLTVPMLFYTALIGFVDVSGCIFTLGALLMWLCGHKRNRVSDFVLMGVCLGIAILLRRWYAFYAVAFVMALAVDGLCFRRSAMPCVAAAAGVAFVLLFLFQPLVSEKLLADYGTMYEAYAQGLSVDIKQFLNHFGCIPLILTAGLILCIIVRCESRRIGIFLLLQSAFCFILFVRVQSHGQQHLLLYVPNYLCVFLMGLECVRIDRRRSIAAAVLLCAVLPSAAPAVVTPLESAAVFPVFSWKPEKRSDADTIVALMRRLDEFGEAGKQVGVLASSFNINDEILRNAEASLSLSRVSAVNRDEYLVVLPQVDQRDGW